METRESLEQLLVGILKDLKAGTKPLHDIADDLGEAADVAYDLAKKEKS